MLGVIIWVIFWLYLSRKAKKLRASFSTMTSKEIEKRVTERINYASIKEFELKPGEKPKLTLIYDGKKAKMKFTTVSSDELRDFLSSKLQHARQR